jgi:hypothetical protein
LLAIAVEYGRQIFFKICILLLLTIRVEEEGWLSTFFFRFRVRMIAPPNVHPLLKSGNSFITSQIRLLVHRERDAEVLPQEKETIMTGATLVLADMNLSLSNVLWWLVVGLIAGFSPAG